MLNNNMYQIVERAVKGEETALEELLLQKGQDIIYISIHLMGNRQDGEDAAQEIMLYIHEHISELKDVNAFQVWLYRIMHGICSNMKRNKRRKVRGEVMNFEYQEKEAIEERTEFLPYELLENQENREDVLRILDELPSQYKTCILMFYYEGMSYKDISRALNISVKSVDNKIRKAKNSIRKKLEAGGKVKNFIDRTYAVAPIPVITAIIGEDVGRKVPLEIVRSMAGKSIELAAVSDPAGKLSGTRGAKTGGGIAGKSLVSAAIVVSSVALGWNMYNKREETAEPESVQQVEETTVSNVRTEPEYKIEEELEKTIVTLEDMIGEEEAEQLRAYGTADTAEKHQVLEFLETIEMNIGKSMWNQMTDEEDTIFYLEKQDKLLMVIIRHILYTDEIGVVWRFTDSDEIMPDNIEISFCYETWNSQEETGE